MLDKGIKRAKDLCTHVGIVVKAEIDLYDKTKNKIVITLYDK